MIYKKVGNIDSLQDIPWDKKIIITGSIGGSRAWFQRMEGTFKNDNNNFRFVNIYGTATCFSKDDFISLNILEYQEAAHEN